MKIATPEQVALLAAVVGPSYGGFQAFGWGIAFPTAEAKAARPKMRKISQWTTPFPISDRNGFGANIWIPAIDIDGYVVAPGDTFDFWNAVGPVTRARG